MSSGNYPVALDLLNKRYSINRLVLHSHIEEILSIKKLDSSSSHTLRKFLDKVNSHIRAFESLGTAKEIANCLKEKKIAAKIKYWYINFLGGHHVHG